MLSAEVESRLGFSEDECALSCLSDLLSDECVVEWFARAVVLLRCNEGREVDDTVALFGTG